MPHCPLTLQRVVGYIYAALTHNQVYLDYIIFMNTLIKEAIIQSKKDGERGLTAKAIRKVQGVGWRWHVFVSVTCFDDD